MRTLILIVLLLISHESLAQEWTRTFTSETYLWGYDLAETYDGGYFIVARNDLPGERIHTALLKTDINGYKRWERKFGFQAEDNDLIINSICSVPGDGWLMTGSYLDSTNVSSPAFLKINYCAEPEWCRIFPTPGLYMTGIQSVPLSDGFLSLVQYNDVVPKNKIALYRLDHQGNIIWSTWIVPADSAIKYIWGREIIHLSDQNYLITGECNYYSSENRKISTQPLLMKVDINGTIIWATPWGVTQNFVGEAVLCSGIASTGLFYSPVTNKRVTFPIGNKPAFIRTKSDGSEAGYVNLMGMSDLSRATCLNFMETNTIFTAATWEKLDGSYIMGVIKTDTIGQEKTTRELIPSINTPTKAINTMYQKYLLMASTNLPNDSLGIILWKLNKNLGFDSVYTKQRMYDSLCSTTILSDTLEAICDSSVIAVDIPDFSKDMTLTIFPLPAVNELFIRIPEVIQKNQIKHNIQSHLCLYQWKFTRVEVFNTSGLRVFTRKVMFGETTIKLDVTGWQRGMYLIRLLWDDQLVGQGKSLLN